MAGFLGAGLLASAAGGVMAGVGAYQNQQQYRRLANEVDQNPYQADFSGFQNPYQAQRYGQINQQQATGVGRANTYGQEWAGRQGELAGVLQQRIAGQRPSVAELQMQASQQAATRQNQSLLLSQRGGNPAMAMRQAQLANAQMQGNIAGQGAQLRAQEQMGAEQQYAQLSTAAQQQALQRAALANDTDQRYLTMAMGADEAAREARIRAEMLRYQQFQDQRTARLATQTGAIQSSPWMAAGGAAANLGGGLTRIGASQLNQPEAAPTPDPYANYAMSQPRVG